MAARGEKGKVPQERLVAVAELYQTGMKLMEMKAILAPRWDVTPRTIGNYYARVEAEASKRAARLDAKTERGRILDSLLHVQQQAMRDAALASQAGQHARADRARRTALVAIMYQARIIPGVLIEKVELSGANGGPVVTMTAEDAVRELMAATRTIARQQPLLEARMPPEPEGK